MPVLFLCAALLATVVPGLSFNTPGPSLLRKHGPSTMEPMFKNRNRNLHVCGTRYAMRTGIQNKIEFYAIPKLPEGVRSTATSTLSRGRGRKGS
eukprot:3140738-Rhodomonas_salina.1